MFLGLWNYMKGYVMIEVSGFSVERFMNLAVHRGVYIWDVTKDGTKVSMKVSAKGFKLLRGCAKKTKCRIKILHKFGLPFFMFRYRKRNIFLFGACFFVFAMYFLSSFVWLIEIEGNERVDTEAILEFCAENELKIGGMKYKIDTLELQKKLIVRFPDISWINVNIKGTRAELKLTEILPKQELLDISVPCDIVAAKTGLITGIVTSAGTPLVKENDVVQAGDVIVSSEITIKEDETGTLKEYVHAISEVRAKMYYTMKFSVPYEYSEKEYSGRIKHDRSLSIFDKNINFINPEISFGNYDKITSMKQFNLGDNYPLPFILTTEEYREFETVTRQRTLEQAKELAGQMVSGRIIREFDFEADIMDKEIEFIEGEDSLEVNALITTIERIDEQREVTADITNDEGSGLDGAAETGDTNPD